MQTESRFSNLLSWLVQRGHMVLGVLAIAAIVALVYVFTQVENIPDFRDYRAGPERKAAFFSYMRPLVHLENAHVLADRSRLERIAAKQDPSWVDRWWLRRLAREYEVDASLAIDDKERIQRLLPRVDAVPMSLALAQAAKESGWGTSRFAREGNSLFGQWCFRPGCGHVPVNRREGLIHEVRSFSTPAESVHSYIYNVNTHERYREFRLARERMRDAERSLSGYELADHLFAYSQRRKAYVNEIKSMIRFNELEPAIARAVVDARPAGNVPPRVTERPQGTTVAILVYHHVATGTPPSTSVTPATFRRHLDYLSEQGFEVLPLEALVQAIRTGGALPPRADPPVLRIRVGEGSFDRASV